MLGWKEREWRGLRSQEASGQCGCRVRQQDEEAQWMKLWWASLAAGWSWSPGWGPRLPELQCVQAAMPLAQGLFFENQGFSLFDFMNWFTCSRFVP